MNRGTFTAATCVILGIQASPHHGRRVTIDGVSRCLRCDRTFFGAPPACSIGGGPCEPTPITIRLGGTP